MKVQLTGKEYFRNVTGQRAYAEEALRRLESVPGVEAASISSPGARASVPVQGVSYSPDNEPPIAVYNVTSAAAARVMGLRVLEGRWITDSEPTSVMVFNESLTRSAFGSENPIGRKIRRRGRPPTFATVVGVVADLKYSKLDQDPEPELYIPYTDAPLIPGMTFMIRTAGNPMRAAPTLREAVAGVDRTQAVFDLMTLERALANSIAPRRFNLFLLGTFAVTALLLALIGIYGVIAYSVARRTHEIGIRMALGARRTEVVHMVVRQGVGISLAGIVIGLIGAGVLTRFMESLLYEVKSSDPQTFAAVVLVLGVTAMAACWIPALRAATVDPVTALRND
jgi:putative ABC transport system permease protein